jgi:hypothetical protein
VENWGQPVADWNASQQWWLYKSHSLLAFDCFASFQLFGIKLLSMPLHCFQSPRLAFFTGIIGTMSPVASPAVFI